MKIAIYALLLFGVNLSLAQFNTPNSGEYVISEGAWGTLHVQAGKKFQIETFGGNAHSCTLSGVISNGKSKIEDSACEVTFKNDGKNVKVATNESSDCRMFCGMRAGFEGLYRKPEPLCMSGAIENSKRVFKKHYLAKNYPAAFDTLNPIATECKQFFNWIESAWVLNDLALTQFKLGNRAACVNTLQPLAKDAAMSDAQIKESYPPTDADNYLPVVHATRTNLKLCLSQ